MNGLTDIELFNHIDSVEAPSSMGIDSVEAQEDPFLRFINLSRSVLSCEEEKIPDESTGPAWNWITSRILKTCITYSSGVTSAILLSDLSQAWSELNRIGGPKKRPECISQLRKKHKRAKLSNTVSIDSIYEKNFLSLTSVLEAVIVDTFLLPGTNIYMLTLGDFWSSNTIDLYLHRRYYNLADPKNAILKKGREIFLTGCYLRTVCGGSTCPRLLPSEYLVILLDEDQDDDAMLLGAQFCSDYFSMVSLDAANKGVSYSLYARIESIGSVEVIASQVHGNYSSLQRKQIVLVDNDGSKMKFLLWNDQLMLANLFSVGSMLALDRPFVASSLENNHDSCQQICLEYGSATQLYLVPFIQHEEQVCVALTQNRHQGSKLLNSLDSTQAPKVSQVTLPCDSQGSIDYSNYPFQLFVIDLRDKMTSISLYGVVTDIVRDRGTAEPTFVLTIEDSTGAIRAKLHFVKSWSIGRLGRGHTVYISGLSCSMAKENCLQVSWSENDVGAVFINLSCLPALLNSSCLHKLSSLSDLSSQTSSTHICRIWLDQIEGSVECKFCECSCNDEVVKSFHLKISLADDTGKVFAWCTSQTAAELLQISPDEFCDLPEEEQIMYPSSLEHEKFTVALVNCRRQGYELADSLMQGNGDLMWEITGALKTD